MREPKDLQKLLYDNKKLNKENIELKKQIQQLKENEAKSQKKEYPVSNNDTGIYTHLFHKQQTSLTTFLQMRISINTLLKKFIN